MIRILCLVLLITNIYAKNIQEQVDYNLIRFSYIGDLAKVKKALQNGADINAKHEDMSALLHAGYKNREDVLKYLLEQGADKNIQSKSGKNILNYAIQNKNTALSKYLLSIDTKRVFSEHESNIFFTATREGDIESVKAFLLENKELNKPININKDDRHYAMQTTYLLTAINYDKEEIAKLLVQNGANINQANTKGETPLLSAMRNQNHKLANFFISKGAKLDSVDIQGNTLLSYALKAKNEELTLKAMASNLNINVLLSRDVAYERNKAYAYYISKLKPDEQHYTYLHMASIYGMTNILKELVKKGLDINEPTSDGLYLDALGFAAFKGHAQSAIYLIENGANPFKLYKNVYPQGSYGLAYWAGAYKKYSLLALATISQNRSEELVQYLLSLKDAKQYINLHNDIFYMNLLISKKAGSNTIVNIVLREFKKWGYENKEIDDRVAKMQENAKLKKQKNRNKKDVINPIEVEINKAIKNADIKTLKRLKEEGINIAQIVPNSLFLAIYHKQTQLIKTLIELDADVNYQTKYSGTLYNALLMQNTKETVKDFEDTFFLLHSNGLDINTKYETITPLTRYLRGYSKYDEAFLNKMLKNAAVIGEGSYALRLIFEYTSIDNLEYILKHKVLNKMLIKELKKTNLTAFTKELYNRRNAQRVESFFEVVYWHNLSLDFKEISNYFEKRNKYLSNMAEFYIL